MACARCCPKDRYNKAIGKAKALDRALKRLYPVSHGKRDDCGAKPPDWAENVWRQVRKAVWTRFYEVMAGTPDIKDIGGVYVPPKPKEKPCPTES